MYVTKGRLKIDNVLYQFLTKEALPGTGINEEAFWLGFADLLEKLTPINKALLETRDTMQARIDEFHQTQANASFADYKAFLVKIGYLQAAPAPFAITTENVDKEIAHMAGPQLVVPINNARYALNAVNARWGSLYDALYGTDAISQEGELAKTSAYNSKRGNAVIQKARELLDLAAPLKTGSHCNSVAYTIEQNELLVSILADDGSILTTTLKQPEQFIGFNTKNKPEDIQLRNNMQLRNKDGDQSDDLSNTDQSSLSAILLVHNGLHIEIQFDAQHAIGKTDPAGIKDLLVESALTTIMDCEDSVAAVDAEDKTLVYKNWLGLMQGALTSQIHKGGKTQTRVMNADRKYFASKYYEPKSATLSTFTLPGRSLMFVRNVGHLMTNNAILFNDQAIFEGIMDGVITSLIAKHDVLDQNKSLGKNSLKNSKTGSIYIVKPKMHGPEEAAFTQALFTNIEQLIGLRKNTLKIGIMDEERRTSLNLAACIKAASERVVFINTGFLDRTGDEIHTSMHKGAFAPKAELKTRPWIHAYEKANVITGLQAGLSGKAQIGKGMWPIPDQMQAMLKSKIAHPQAGANTAWVPSPTGATLHAMHYHQVNVFDVQNTLANEFYDGTNELLDIPLLNSTSTSTSTSTSNNTKLSPTEIQHDLDNNVQGILGYVVRWVHQGIGCSKVLDINNVGLMEDRATLRISSQHIANWLHHGLVNQEQVNASLEKMAALVDQQNADDPNYIPMLPDINSSIGFKAAQDLIFKGKEQPNGYTEPLLHARRLQMKAHLALTAKVSNL